MAPLRHKNLQNLNDLRCDLSRSPKLKCDGVKASTYMVFCWCLISNMCPDSALLCVISLQNMSDHEYDRHVSPWVTTKAQINSIEYYTIDVLNLNHELALTGS